VAFNRKLVAAFVQAGIPVLAGSDSLVPGVAPGFALHDELEALAAVGMSPCDHGGDGPGSGHAGDRERFCARRDLSVRKMPFADPCRWAAGLGSLQPRSRAAG
jgi:hypothetical protein